MNEAADVANSIPAIILLSLWWAFLSTLELLYRPRETGTTEQSTAKPSNDNRSIADNPSLADLRALDPNFDADAFVEGAKRAYEMVLHAYALCDIETLRPLLSIEVLQAFTDACDRRNEEQETLEMTFIGFESAQIVSAETSSEAMEITVLVRAQIVSATRSASGGIVSGDPNAVTVTADLWTFSRSGATEGAWVVIATDEAPEPA